ncbi:hypothetical protein [Lysobacter sp. Root983]|uniref:hypothetical protein n=1 Tax=Lysobacter sp. Root983 TaxID=1736613 RepID=UPI00070B7DC5|nr:hypothetical protein [Lysobacter sp. Root983]KRD79864.1 hypothetical protein ASE43_02905 [Lysobacter sp. Root983]
MWTGRKIDIESLPRGAWRIAVDLLKIGFPAFFIIGGLHWLGGDDFQKALTIGFVFVVVPSSFAGAIEVRSARQRRRVYTFTSENWRVSMFAGLWAVAWAIPFVLSIGLLQWSFQPYMDYLLAPLVWGGVGFVLAALPVGRR